MDSVIQANAHKHQHEDDAQKVEPSIDEGCCCIGECTANHEGQECQKWQLDAAKHCHEEGGAEHQSNNARHIHVGIGGGHLVRLQDGLAGQPDGDVRKRHSSSGNRRADSREWFVNHLKA